MSEPSVSFTQTFAQSPQEVFDAVLDVRGWWGKNLVGNTDAQGEEFVYRVPGVHYSWMRITDLVPNERVEWLAVDNRITFVEDKTEWNDTRIVFEITPLDDGTTQLRFVHIGLEKEFECFDVCHKAWGFYINTSLRQLITTGTGLGNEYEDEVAAVEARMEAAAS